MSSNEHFNAFHRFIIPSALGLGLLAATTFACSDAADSDEDSDSGASSSSGGPTIENPPDNTEDSGGGTTDSGHTPDAAGHTDAGHADAGHTDGGLPESGISDSGTSDSGAHDSGIPDSGVKDTGTPDTGAPDTGAPDSGAPDSGGYDGGLSPATCIERTQTRYLLRNDGKLLFDDGKTAVIDAATGLPLTNVTSVADGYDHGCASTSDGQAVCWRLSTDTYANSNGQLGNGTTGDKGTLYRATPVLMAAGKPLSKVATMADGTSESYYHGGTSCAITSEGKIYCWGELTWLVNNGTYLASPYAQLITVNGFDALTKVTQLAYTSTYACALVRGSGTNEVWCWGENTDYNLGQGDNVKRQFPTKVLGLANPTQVSIADYYSYKDGTTCAIDGGNVKCWGNNTNGACGNDGPDTSCVNPVTVLGPGGGTALNNVTQLVGSGFNYSYPATCALRDNAVWCWGNNYAKHATSIGVPNVVGLSSTGVLADDGVFHPFLVSSGKTVNPFCGPL